jgi:hypothetical protein
VSSPPTRSATPVREHQHRRVAALAAPVAQQLDAAAAREGPVEDHQVVAVDLHELRGPIAVARHVDGVGRVAQDLAHGLCQEFLVLDDQDAHLGPLLR